MYYQYSQKKAAAADRNTKERDYWLNQLAGELTKAGFYYDNKNTNANRGKKDKITFQLIGDIFVRLCQLSRNSPHALHMIAVAALTILLDRYTNLEDIIIGSPIYKQDIEGEFINTLLALRNRVEDNMTFKEFLVTVKNVVTEAVENQNYPIETLLYKLNMEFSSHDFPLFDVIVLVENVHDKKYIQHIKPNVIFSFLQTDEAVEGVVEYNPDLYDQTTIEKIISHFTCLLQSVLTNLDLKLSAIAIFPGKEKERLLFELNDSKRAFVRDRCYPQLFEEQAAKDPQRTAAVHNDRQITYGELNGKSNQLAALLRERGVTPDHLVAVLCERSIEMLIGIMAVFKAGGAYIPFEIDSPPQRIKTILTDAEARVLLTTSTAVSKVGTLLFYGLIGTGTQVNDIIYLDQPGETPWNSDLAQDRERFKTYKLAALLSGDHDNKICPELPIIHREMMLRYHQQTLTYDECMTKMQQFRRFIASKELFKNKDRESPLPRAAVICDNPLYLIVVLLALQSSQIPFRVITPPLNKEKKREITNSSSISVIVSQGQFLDELDQLFWESRTLKNYIIVDHYDYKTSQKELDLRKVWDVAAGESTEAINDYRWNSIYTDEPFSIEEMNQYLANIRAKLEPYLTAETRVLEVGCGHGLVLFDIAPRVGYYYATDLTPVIIEKNRTRVQREGLHHVELKALAASQIDTLEARDFDIFICSSVIHFFPNTIFLEEAINGAIDLLKDEGIIYLDDMLDLRKKPDLIDSKVKYKQNNPGSRVRLGNEDSDLYVDIDFFRYLQDKYPEIIQWECSRKLGTIENELTRFRFDVLIKIDKKKANKDTNNRLPALNTGKGRYTIRDIEMQPAFPFPDTNLPRTGIEMKDAPAPVGDVLGGSCIERYSKENLKSVNKPLDLSYVIYTSGTTGIPKGVMIHHQGMLNHIEAKINDLAITANDVIAQTASACFDISVWQFLAGLLTGGYTFIIDKESILDPEVLLVIIQKSKVTIWESVPSLMTAFIHLVAYKGEKEKRLNHLRWMILTGEALGFHLVKEWYGYYPGIKVLNAYGPTEASDDVTHYVVENIPLSDRTPANVPIGKPIQNTHIYILDRNLSLCPIGVMGEICAAGVGIGRGYWKDPDKTGRSFITNPYVNEIGDPDYAVLYKTGDIGYLMEDGNIQCLGRLDHQVKIRGNRIELAEIETRLLNHAEITEAVVIVRTMFKAGEPDEGGQGSEQGNKYLCAYFVTKPGSPVSAAELREYLAGELPDYMLPAYLVRLEKIPLTTNGKIDREALPTPEISAENGYVAPRNKLEETLVEIWSRVLELEKEKISIDTNFFELGGHSLNATIMISSLHKELNVKVPLVEIFKNSTIKQLSAYINGLAESKYAAIESVEKKEYYTLSSAQKRMYIIQQIDPTNTAYNSPQLVPMETGLDKERLQEIVNKLLHRHESFRTSFDMIANEPVQIVHPGGQFHIDYYDFEPRTGKSSNEIEKIVKNFVKPFNLNKVPILRGSLIKIEDNRHILLMDVHHIISDGVSDAILVNDFYSLYEGKELPGLRIQYKDYSEWQNREIKGGILKQQEEFWLQQFSGEIPVLNLPIDYPRPEVQNFEGDVIDLDIDKTLTKKIMRLVKEKEVTLNVLLLAVYSILLAKYSSQEDIVIGTAVAGRPHADLQQIIGMFVNMLPIRIHPNKNKTFDEFQADLKFQAINAYENQDYQFDDLVLKLGLQGNRTRNPIFDVTFVMQNTKDLIEKANIKANNEDDLSQDIPQLESQHQLFDLILQAVEGNDVINMWLEYSTALFKSSTAKGMARHYVDILKQVVENPNLRVEEITISHDFLLAGPGSNKEDQGDFRF